MPVVEIEPDVYAFLRGKVRDFNETVSAVLRRELSLPKPDTAPPTAVETSLPIDAPTPLAEFIAGLKRQYRRTATAKFLAVLGFIHERDPKAFEKVLQFDGRSRKYFARSRQEITSSGTSTHPKQIPGSDYWVMTNADTGQKRDMLRQVLKTLGYAGDDIRAAADAF
jgi:negative modulator of initiation of replication